MSEHQEGVSMIAEGKDYELLASADKACFILRSKADLSTAHLQGEDATRFQTDYEGDATAIPGLEAGPDAGAALGPGRV